MKSNDTFIDRVENLFSNINGNNYVDLLSDFRSPPRYSLHTTIFLSDIPIKSSDFSIRSLNSSRGKNRIKISSLNGDFSYRVVQTSLRDDHPSRESLHAFISLPIDRIYLLISFSRGSRWRKEEEHIQKSSKFHLYKTFLKQSELKQLLDNYRLNNPNEDLRISRIVKKTRLLSSRSKKRIATDILFTDISTDFIFGQAIEENTWFKSISFFITDQQNGYNRQVSNGVITKYGRVSCDFFYQSYHEGIIKKYIEIAKQKAEFFSKRGRLQTENYEIRPMKITFRGGVIEKKIERKRFLETVNSLKSSTVTVLHGNPYIHLNLVDDYDGSCTELWVLKKDSILLMPQLKSTESSLKRIINHIFENFSDGEVSDWNG